MTAKIPLWFIACLLSFVVLRTNLSFPSGKLSGAWSGSILKAKRPGENGLISELPGIIESSEVQIVKMTCVIFYNPGHHVVLA